MQNSSVKICLWPINGGSCTRLQLTGVVHTSMTAATLWGLAQKLSACFDTPIECVLSVDEEATHWCEWWIERLADIPARLLEVILVVRNKKKRTGSECQ